MDKASQHFIKHVRNHLSEYDGKLILGRGKNVNCGDGCRSTGFFSDSPLQIRVAKKNLKDFLTTVAHEYAHFLQWLEMPKQIIEADDRASILVFDWLSGKSFNKKEVEKAFCRVMIMERDAERRTMELIKKFNLNVDIDKYIRQANCYIYMHWIMQERRSWKYRVGVKDPMHSKNLISQMPNTFKAKSDRKIPSNIRNALLAFFP